MTGVIHRILMVIPAAKLTAVQNWINNNLDAGQGSNWFSIGLSASGSTPATAYADCFGITTPQALMLLRKLCAMSSITPPADFDTYTKQQIITWVQSQIPAIKTSTGIWLTRCDNDGTWDDFTQDLASQGLQTLAFNG